MRVEAAAQLVSNEFVAARKADHVRCGRMGKANPAAAPRPRVPALVKREVADSREEEEEGEDTQRLQYRGFDKSKLNASRKQQRKEARMNKKKGKADHQVSAIRRVRACSRCIARVVDRSLTSWGMQTSRRSVPWQRTK
jgi:hypothetical protein